ncbi:hypothetical protein pb186bvf_010722 [Paramecium bursaria]
MLLFLQIILHFVVAKKFDYYWFILHGFSLVSIQNCFSNEIITFFLQTNYQQQCIQVEQGLNTVSIVVASIHQNYFYINNNRNQQVKTSVSDKSYKQHGEIKKLAKLHQEASIRDYIHIKSIQEEIMKNQIYNSWLLFIQQRPYKLLLKVLRIPHIIRQVFIIIKKPIRITYKILFVKYNFHNHLKLSIQEHNQICLYMNSSKNLAKVDKDSKYL